MIVVWPDLWMIVINPVHYYLSFTLQWAKPEPDPGAKGDRYIAVQSGYAFFGPDGAIIGKPVLASNYNRSISLQAGTVYFNVVAGNSFILIDIMLH